MDVIFDLDGTLADCGHRLHFIQSKPKNWKAFFAGMEHDTPIEPTVKVARKLYVSGGCNLIFCTGRPVSHYHVTRTWLSEHVGKWTERCPLYMRPSGDHRPDYEIKAILLAAMHADGLKPEIAFEDREQVVKMWRQAGLICYQVQEGVY